MKTYAFHPYADLFPMMSPGERQALAEDIKVNGLRHPIVLYKGLILDGRNRYLSCKDATVEPTFTDHEGDDASALALVISLNSLRRDLTAAQRAITAARAWGLDGYSKGGRPSKEKPLKSLEVSLPLLVTKLRTSQPSILQARDLLSEAPDLAAMVEANSLSLAKATEQLDERQRKAKQAQKDAARVAEFSEAISNGEMTVEQALAKVVEREREEKEWLKNRKMSLEIWFQHLTEILTWLDEWPGTRSDEELAQYNSPDEPETDYAISREDIEEGIRQLQRIAVSTPTRRSNGRHAQRGKKTYADRIREAQGRA